ncbi:MAG: hypothetical protein UHM85_02100 [Acutalibacteraceae bacterium]|nr:hypothetical protein [Acutalibacteraceae bacterium]
MQKKLKLVLLALKMTVIGFVIDSLNYLLCKSAMTIKTKHYRFLSYADNLLHGLRAEFQRTELIYLAVFEPRRKIKAIKTE